MSQGWRHAKARGARDALPIAPLPRQNRGGVTAEPPVQLPTIGGYEIVGLLGTGGMAQVLLGRQTGPNGFERPVVVKRILPHLVRRQSFVDMFLDEARTIANIRHPNVVNIYDFRHQDGELFMVMEYLEGETAASLRRRLNARGERMPVTVWCHIFAETCAGLHAAHQATNEVGLPLNLVHRDVSPPNILVTYDGAVKLIDFGIAKSDHRSSHTDAGHIKGKYAYMSPEQAEGRPLDARSDVFSLGTVLFEMTTGQRLFKRETELLTVQAVCNDPIPEPREEWPEYTEALHAICTRALARNPAERYQSALEMRRDLLALVRADESASMPEELIGLFMQDIFEDRIDLKRGLLHRVRKGERFDTVSSPTDSVIAVSTLMTGALPVEPAVTIGEDAEPPPISPSPPEISSLGPTLLMAIAMMAAVVIVLAVGSGEKAEPPAPEPPPPVAETVPVVPPKTEVTLEFASDPSGATVTIDERIIGTTPLTVDWPKSETTVALRLEQDGYDPWTMEITPNRDVLVQGILRKVRRRRRRRRGPRRIRRPEVTNTARTSTSSGTNGNASQRGRDTVAPSEDSAKARSAARTARPANAASPTSAARPDRARTDTARPDTARPDTARPEAVRPDARTEVSPESGKRSAPSPAPTDSVPPEDAATPARAAPDAREASDTPKSVPSETSSTTVSRRMAPN